jgi:hypothetical protein
VLTLVAMNCDIRLYLVSFQRMLNLIVQFFMIYIMVLVRKFA